MRQWLKEVARGKRGARDLTLEEAREAARLLVNREATPAQIGAFLVAERIKMESADEIQAFVEALRAAAGTDGTVQDGAGIDCAGPYAGRRHAFHASFAAAFLLAEAGLPVTLHGAKPLPPKFGTTLHGLLQALGIDPDAVSLERFDRAARETGVRYAPAERLCPPLANLRPIREQLGVRTVLNTAEKLVNYGGSPFVALGIFHHTVVKNLSLVLSRIGYRRAAIVQGVEGSEDLFLDRPTSIWLVEGETVERRILDPEDYGMKREVPKPEWTDDLQAETAVQVLKGEAEGVYADFTVLNAAFRMQLTGLVGTMEEGIEKSRQLLASMKPFERFLRWKKMIGEDERVV